MADDDPPFDLSRFDPLSVDLSHLDRREQNRIKARQYEHWELSLLLQRQNPWTKSGKPHPLPSSESHMPGSHSVDRMDREPTETEVVALMHDDDLLEYTSSSPSDRRRNSMFEFYKQQWKAARAAEERSKKVGALRKAFNPNAKPRIRFIDKVRTASKVGTIYLLDWVLLAIIVGAVLAFGGVAMSEEKYTLAEILFFFGIGLFIAKAIYDHRNHELKTHLMVFFMVIGSAAFLSLVGWVEWDRRHQKHQDVSATNASAPEVKQPSKTGTTQSQDDLRAALRADGNRAIRLVTVRVNLKRKYSIDEIGHFRIMYEVASVTDRITPEFYLAGQDYYDVNTFVDPKMKQFGYRWTARYREPNNTYRPIPSFSKGRQYGATTGITPSADVLEFSWDLYNQIPSDKILEDLNGKYLYIFVTESLADKISEVSFRVNNWELFSVRADRLIFPDDKPIAPWFMVLSNEEKAVSWKGVYVRNDEPLPPEVTSRFNGNPGWVWSLDFGILHPRRLPEPELKVDPFKPS